MNLSDLATGPDWIIWVTVIILAALSVILILGHGGWLIAGYNTSSKEEKAKYNEKKLGRTMGIGLLIITFLLFIMGLFEDKLPANFAFISIAIILLDVFIMIIICNTLCKK